MVYKDLWGFLPLPGTPASVSETVFNAPAKYSHQNNEVHTLATLFKTDNTSVLDVGGGKLLALTAP